MNTQQVWCVAYDGEPMMEGGHRRIRTREFHTLELAERALETLGITRSYKPNMRIETRHVTEWEPCGPSTSQ